MKKFQSFLLTSRGENLYQKDTKFTLCEGCKEPILDRLVFIYFYLLSNNLSINLFYNISIDLFNNLSIDISYDQYINISFDLSNNLHIY